MKSSSLVVSALLCMMLLVSGCAEMTTLWGMPPKEFTGTEGVTTEADVVAAFGKPYEVREMWVGTEFRRTLDYYVSTNVSYTFCYHDGRCATNMWRPSGLLQFTFGQDGFLEY